MQVLNKFLFYLSVIILFFFNDYWGSQGLFFAAFVLGSFVHLLFKNVVYAYILCILIIINPNAAFPIETFGIEFPFLKIKDIFFYAALLFSFLPYQKEYSISKDIKRLLPFLILFTFYQMFVSIMVKLNYVGVGNFFKAIEYFKEWLFGIYLLIPTYKIVRLDSDLFIRTIVQLALFFAIIALISVYTDYQIIQFHLENRFDDAGGTVRKMIHNAELFKITIFVAVTIYFVPLANKTLFYITGILSLALPLIGMYRLELSYTIFTIFLVIHFSSKNYKTNLFKFVNLIFCLIGIFLVFLVIFPDFANGLMVSFVATFSEFMGNTEAGTTQSRTIIELPNQLALIHSSPILGVGFRPEWWMNYDNLLDWGLSDVPITGTLAMYGIVGMFIYYSRFFIILRDTFRANKFVKFNPFNLGSLDLAVLFSLGAYFINMITFKFFYISWELTIHNQQAEFGILLGIFYALMEKLKVGPEVEAIN